jgi:putative hydrolase of HD superfamily
MYLLVEPYLGIKVDSTKILKMIITHDFIEALVGNLPAFDTFNDEVKQLKIENETQAIEDIRMQLDNEVGTTSTTCGMGLKPKQPTRPK